MAAKPHLHILMRIDMLLPCLHDLSCVFMCAASLYGHCAEIGLSPASRWHLLCRENIRGTRFSEHFWKRIHFKRGSIQLVQRKHRHTPTSSASQIYICADGYAENIPFLPYGKKEKSGHLCVNYLQVSHWLLIRGIIPVKPTAAYPSRNNIMPCREGPCMDQYFGSSAKWHSVASVIDVQNDNYSLFRNKAAKWRLVKLL